MEDNSRFLVVEKEVGYGEDFILDIPLSEQVNSIKGILVSSNCAEIKTQQLKADNKIPFFGNSLGYADYVARTNPSHKYYARDFKYLEESLHPLNYFGYVNNSNLFEYEVRLFMTYAMLNTMSKEHEQFFNQNYFFVTLESFKKFCYNIWGRYNWQGDPMWISSSGDSLSSVVRKRLFDMFFNTNSIIKYVTNMSKIPFVFDYSRFQSGTMTVSHNGENIILSNARVSLNQPNKTLQNNLINVGNWPISNGFLRCTYFSRDNNIEFKYTPEINQYDIDKNAIRIKVKIYIKYEKRE